MATIAEIGNLVNCGRGADLGTGDVGCEAVLQATTSIWFTKRGFVFDKTQQFSQEYIAQLQAERKLIILNGIKEFTTNREDNVTETDADGTISVTRKGLYAFNAMFKKGFNYQSALSSLDSFGLYDTTFVDSNGNVLGTTSSDGSLKGMTTGMVQADGVNFATFSTRMSQGLSFQFLDRDEVDTDYYFISQKELDWKPQKQDGVNEVVLEFTAVPANLGTTITVKAKLRQGGGVFTGIDYQDFLLKVDGVTANPTAGNDNTTAGTYVLTVGALSTNEVLAISLYDNANSREGITVDGDIYKSNTATTVVVA